MEGSQGRAVLQRAVSAVQDACWDDLTCLLQSHAPALQEARRRPEKQALERRDCPQLPARLRAGAPEPTGTKSADRGLAATLDGEKPQQRLLNSWGSGGALDVVGWLFRRADEVPWQALLAVQGMVLASFLPALAYNGFIMDDTVAIEKNPNVIAEQLSLAELLSRDFWGLPMFGSGWTNKSFRPLVTLSFRWNYLLHGLDSCGFHITNVLLHCAASVLVGRTAFATTGLPGSWAALAALLFGLHPVHTENVLYLVGRADVLAAALGLMAVNAYSGLFRPPPSLQVQQAIGAAPESMEPRQAWGVYMLLLPVALVVASGLCKETGFTLFGLFMLMELLDFVEELKSLSAAALRGRAAQRAWHRTRLRVIGLLVSTFLVFAARYRHTGGTSLNMSPQDNPISFEASRLVRGLSYAYLHGVYAKLLVWPQFLCYDYSMDAIPAVRGLQDCRLLQPVTAYVGFMAAIAASLRMPARYRRACLLSLALLVATFFPASNILFPVGTVIGERLLYVPSVGFCLFVTVCLHRAFSQELAAPEPAGAADPHASAGSGTGSAASRAKRHGRARSREPQLQDSSRRKPMTRVLPIQSVIFVGVVLLVLFARTLARVRVWESGESLFINDGHKQPTSSKTQFNLGITYMQLQEWDAAVEALVRCAHADPLSSLPFYRIGQIEILRGRFQSAEDWLSAALDKFGASLMVRDEEVFHDLSVAMFQNGKVAAAETRLRLALQLNPDFAKGWNNLACCVASRSLHDAMRASQKATALAPDNPQYWANLALLAKHVGEGSTSIAAWRQATSLWPAIPEPRDCTWEFAPAG